MKRRYTTLLGFFFLFCGVNPGSLLGQCTNQVMHTAGSALVAGVNVTVTTTGNTCNWTTYCPAVTQPFFIGYNPGLGSGPGDFTFTFSPAITGIRLNFSGASSSPPSVEEVRLHINGAHYPMAAVGSANGCDPMAILTMAGDLQGCPGCGVSGWSNTNITGFPITTLRVEDFVLGGTPNGSLFSLWICPAILAADWVSFDAKVNSDKAVDLAWTTATEINNDYFTIERSADGDTWQAIGNVDAVSNSDVPTDYAFIDNAPLQGQNQYRIRETSMDGASSLSNVEQVEVLTNPGIHVSPNPAHDFVQIAMEGAEEATVILRNQLGQTVYAPQTTEVDKVTLRTADLARGVYFLEIKSLAGTFAQKLVVE